MKKYLFILENEYSKHRIAGHAYTLAGIRHIFKKVTNANRCEVYKKLLVGYDDIPFITYHK